METIQVGQTWRTRGGHEVVVRTNIGGIFPWLMSNSTTCNDAGRFANLTCGEEYDLVELIAGPGSLPPTAPVDEPTKGHIHAAQMAEFARDAATHERPWELWETSNDDGKRWYAMSESEGFLESWLYRRKPRTIRIGAFDVPEPLRVAPAVGTLYFVADPSDLQLTHSFSWANTGDAALWLARGLAHLSPEAARMHAEALLSFTQVAQ